MRELGSDEVRELGSDEVRELGGDEVRELGGDVGDTQPVTTSSPRSLVLEARVR